MITLQSNLNKSHTPTSTESVLLGKMAYHTKQIRRQCIIDKTLRILLSESWTSRNIIPKMEAILAFL